MKTRILLVGAGRIPAAAAAEDSPVVLSRVVWGDPSCPPDASVGSPAYPVQSSSRFSLDGYGAPAQLAGFTSIMKDLSMPNDRNLDVEAAGRPARTDVLDYWPPTSRGYLTSGIPAATSSPSGIGQ